MSAEFRIILLLSFFLLCRSNSFLLAAEFHGYPCTEDCSGHEAGYEWAEQHDIQDTDYNNGNSESFNEGVRSYAEEMQGQTQENTQDEDQDPPENEDADSGDY